MKFHLVRLICNKGSTGDFTYHSYIEQWETMHSAPAGHKKFANQQEMTTVMIGILATQRRKASFVEMLKRIETKGSLDFVGEDSLDLTDEQAESLGWPRIGAKK